MHAKCVQNEKIAKQQNIMEKMEREFTMEFKPKRYLDEKGNLRLPEPIRAYVGPVGYEYDQLTHAQRLVDLGYLVTRGFDIKQSIRSLLDDHPDYEDDVMEGIYYLLLEMRGYEGACWLDPMEEKVSGFKLLNLLVKDLPLYYELEGDVFEPDSPYMDRPIIHHPSVHGIKNMKWDMDAVAKSKENFTRKNVVELQQLTTEDWIRKGYGFMKEEE